MGMSIPGETFELKTEVEIDASPEQVWKVLTDFEKYDQWNPFVTSISGKLAEGERLRVVLSPPESRDFVIKPVLLKVAPGEELRWRGKLAFEFLFAGEHYFRLHALEDGRTRLAHCENFSGWLVKYLGRTFTHTARGFVGMNQALKKRVEAG